MSKSLDGVLIKAAHKKETFTESQIRALAMCMDPKTGCQHFLSNYFYIQHPTKGKMLYQPFDYQKRLIDTYNDHRFSISLLPRQTGKSTSAAGYLLWYAMFVPDSTILVAAHKYAGAQEIMQRVRYAYESVPNHIRAGVTSYNKGSIDFDNGSRIVAMTTTENTGRGMSISLLYADEFAFVRPTIAREFWTSISPTLSTGGKAIITSTPNSDEDQFAFIWKQANKNIDEFGNEQETGINGFRAFRAEWWEHPDRDDKWKAEEIGRIGEDRFRREHGLEFLIYDETLINATTLLELEPREPVFKQGQVRWFKQPEKDKTYVISLDPSLGTGGDFSAIQIYELPSLEQAGEWQHNKTPIPQQIKLLQQITSFLAETVDKNNIYYSIENNTIGEAALISIAEIGEENIPGTFLTESKSHGNSRRFRKGFNTTQRNKLAACAKLKSLVESKKLKVHSKNLISELKTFVANGGSYAAKVGETDDLVMSLVLITRMMQGLQSFDANLDTAMRDHNDSFVEPMPFVIF